MMIICVASRMVGQAAIKEKQAEKAAKKSK